MSFISLIFIEITKLKRSQALLMSLLCPLAVVMLQLAFVMESSGQFIEEKGWTIYWQATVGLWYMFMLPLYIALITTLVNHIEHKSNGLRLMASMPIDMWRLFLAKFIVSWGFILFSSLVMYFLTSASIIFMTLLGYEGQDAFTSPFLSHLYKIAIAALPILAIGHILSWRFKNIVLPLAVGVVMTISSMKMIGSEVYWIYNPWTYHVVSAQASEITVQLKAMSIGGGLGMIMLIVGAIWARNQQIHD